MQDGGGIGLQKVLRSFLGSEPFFRTLIFQNFVSDLARFGPDLASHSDPDGRHSKTHPFQCGRHLLHITVTPLESVWNSLHLILDIQCDAGGLRPQIRALKWTPRASEVVSQLLRTLVKGSQKFGLRG